METQGLDARALPLVVELIDVKDNLNPSLTEAHLENQLLALARHFIFSSPYFAVQFLLNFV